MADSEEVLKELDPPDDVEIIGIVVNEKGAQRAIATEAVRTLGFPLFRFADFSAEQPAPDFRRCDRRIGKNHEQGRPAGLDTVVYISMAFGNPYGDPWNVGEVVDAVDLLESLGVRTISLADTVGLAGPAQIRELCSAVISKFDYLEIGLHLHSRPDQAAEKILAAYDAGCRRFDSALGRTGRMSLCARRAGGKYRNRKSGGGVEATRGGIAGAEAAGCRCCGITAELGAR